MIREELKEDETLATFAAARRAEVLFLPGVEILHERALDLDSESARELAYRWRDGSSCIEGATILLESVVRSRRTITTFLMGCAPADAAELRPIFARLLESLRFGNVPTSAQPRISDVVPRRADPTATPIPEIPIPGVSSRRSR